MSNLKQIFPNKMLTLSYLKLVSVSALLMNKEDKFLESGDAYMQNIVYYFNYWKDKEIIQKFSYLPTFLVEQRGTQFSISGALTTNNILIDHFVTFNVLSSHEF